MFDRLIGKYLLEQNLINKSQLLQIYHLQESNRAKLGVIAVSEKLMTIAQAEQVNALQATMDKRFGDIAIEKGYLSETQVGRLLELQGNEYLAFVQALVDSNIMTLEQIHDAENEYQRLNGYTESDMNALKSGDVERIVPIFVDAENPLYRSMFAMGIKNMYRLVDSHVYIGKNCTAKYDVLLRGAIHFGGRWRVWIERLNRPRRPTRVRRRGEWGLRCQPAAPMP